VQGAGRRQNGEHEASKAWLHRPLKDVVATFLPPEQIRQLFAAIRARAERDADAMAAVA